MWACSSSAPAGLCCLQSSNIIAGAVNARDAQQSSGIQTATRNVGQAIGVAILGVVMLFSITGTFKDAALSSADLSILPKPLSASRLPSALCQTPLSQNILRIKRQMPMTPLS
ncbi:MAG: hypothetical protein ACLR2G_06685 [Phascolarctobacterium faecium]